MPQPDNALETKTFGAFEIKDAEQGEVGAVVATLGVVDKDGDVLLPGSFPESSSVKMSSYGHSAIFGEAPAGKGTITIDGDKAIFRGKFFMSTELGRESFHTVKELGPEGEWSFGFPRDVKTEDLTDEWRAKGARRLIAKLSPIEASPVFVGAGVGTGTLFAKGKEDPPPPDPAIEAARLMAETKAQATATANAEADKIFTRFRRLFGRK